MRSRYSAYAVGDVHYIMKTTHSDNPTCSPDREKWRRDITQFCEGTQFVSLEIIDTTDGASESFVTFTATLMQEGQDASFTERSKFYNVDGQWLYHSGEVQKGVKK
jgi:SEC-C motif domain protein